MTNRNLCTLFISCFFVVTLLIGLTGCGAGFRSTAASMRVEVEVYKGPLSKGFWSQWAELKSMLNEVSDSLTIYNDSLIALAADKDFWGLKDAEPCEKPKMEIRPSLDGQVSSSKYHRIVRNTDIWNWCDSSQNSSTGCLLMAGICDDVTQLINRIEALKSNLNSLSLDVTNNEKKEKIKIKPVLIEASAIAHHLKAKAFYWAESHVSASPWSRRVRIAMANFSNLASEYGNQLSARSDVLLKQIDEVPDRQKLPLSAFLRDSSPTDFLNLYVWNRAVGPALPEDLLYHPIDSLSKEETADRVRAIERLFADQYWSKINTVYASGQGEFRMALIKDDIGNWNLKSFDNDPTELLKTYTDLSRAAIKEVMKVVQAGISGGGTEALTKALEVTNQLAQGRADVASSSIGVNLKKFRDRTIKRLEELKKKAVEEEKGLSKADLKRHQLKTIEEIKNIIENYNTEINVLQETFVPESQTKSSKQSVESKITEAAGSIGR